jgi:hypothetical protein
MATNRENALELLRSAGEVLGEAATLPELSALVGAFKSGLALPGGPFLATQITFERRANTTEDHPDGVPAAQRVCRQTGGRLVKAGAFIPAALANIEATPEPEDKQ